MKVVAPWSPASTQGEALRAGCWRGLELVPYISDLCLDWPAPREKAISLTSLGLVTRARRVPSTSPSHPLMGQLRQRASVLEQHH